MNKGGGKKSPEALDIISKDIPRSKHNNNNSNSNNRKAAVIVETEEDPDEALNNASMGGPETQELMQRINGKHKIKKSGKEKAKGIKDKATARPVNDNYGYFEDVLPAIEENRTTVFTTEINSNAEKTSATTGSIVTKMNESNTEKTGTVAITTRMSESITEKTSTATGAMVTRMNESNNETPGTMTKITRMSESNTEKPGTVPMPITTRMSESNTQKIATETFTTRMSEFQPSSFAKVGLDDRDESTTVAEQTDRMKEFELNTFTKTADDQVQFETRSDLFAPSFFSSKSLTTETVVIEDERMEASESVFDVRSTTRSGSDNIRKAKLSYRRLKSPKSERYSKEGEKTATIEATPSLQNQETSSTKNVVIEDERNFILTTNSVAITKRLQYERSSIKSVTQKEKVQTTKSQSVSNENIPMTSSYKMYDDDDSNNTTTSTISSSTRFASQTTTATGFSTSSKSEIFAREVRVRMSVKGLFNDSSAACSEAELCPRVEAVCMMINGGNRTRRCAANRVHCERGGQCQCDVIAECDKGLTEKMGKNGSISGVGIKMSNRMTSDDSNEPSNIIRNVSEYIENTTTAQGKDENSHYLPKFRYKKFVTRAELTEKGVELCLKDCYSFQVRKTRIM